MKVNDPSQLDWSDSPILPVVIRDATRGMTLTLAWANREAVAKTLETGLTWLWSRSRKQLWQKGETSGNVQRVVEIAADCDRDAIIYDVIPSGPGCHVGKTSCFDDPPFAPFRVLERTILGRKARLPEGSYTTDLLRRGTSEISKKVGEEAIEVVIACGLESSERLVSEVADLIYHLSVMLVQRNLGWSDVDAELHRREGRVPR